MIFFEASRQLSEVVRRAIYSPGSHTCGKPCCASAASLLPSRLSGEWKAKMCKERTYRTGKVVGLQQTFSLWIICSPGRNMLWTGSEVQGVFGFRSNGENSPLALHVLNKEKNKKNTLTCTPVCRVLKCESFCAWPSSRRWMHSFLLQIFTAGLINAMPYFFHILYVLQAKWFFIHHSGKSINTEASLEWLKFYLV